MHPKIKIAIAKKRDLKSIDTLRHSVYATELGQFEPSAEKSLHDRPEVESTYIVAYEGDKLAGFVGITAPSSPAYSIDHYILRSQSGLTYTDGLFEIRALTVIDQSRGTHVAPALMYAAFRYAQEHGARELIAIGHRKVRNMYIRLGMRPRGLNFKSGKLDYELLSASVESIEK